jgi:hypothetical protein
MKKHTSSIVDQNENGSMIGLDFLSILLFVSAEKDAVLSIGGGATKSGCVAHLERTPVEGKRLHFSSGGALLLGVSWGRQKSQCLRPTEIS